MWWVDVFIMGEVAEGPVKRNYEKHSPFSPLISGDVGDDDKINERKVVSARIYSYVWGVLAG